MKTDQWIKKLGGYAGELYIAAELSKRGIPNSLLPENFSDDDIMFGNKEGTKFGFIQVKSCHPDRSSTFWLLEKNEEWIRAKKNQFVVFVWLGSVRKNESPKYWITTKAEVGKACISHHAHGTTNGERRFHLNGQSKNPKLKNELQAEWENNWAVLDQFQ